MRLWEMMWLLDEVNLTVEAKNEMVRMLIYIYISYENYLKRNPSCILFSVSST